MSTTNLIGRAGEHYVAAELNRRGAYASPFSGNVPGIDIVSTDKQQTAMAYIQVKTKALAGEKRRWAVSVNHGWEIPKGHVECFALGTCEASSCLEATGKVSTHSHHAKVTDLVGLHERVGTPNHYWVFVSLEELGYWIVPDSMVRDEMIRQPYRDYLQKHGGHRPGHNHASLDMSIYPPALSEWKGRWSALGLGLQDSG